MIESDMDQLWDFFDCFYCISLADRVDRRRQARVQFGLVGLLDRVEFVIVERHPHDCERGIYESHLECIRKGLANGAQNMVIFEDDVLFERFEWECLGHCIAFLKRHSEWGVFFWGCLVNGSVPTGYPNVVKISYRCLAHAYAFNRPLAEMILKKPWRDVPYDVMLRSVTEDSYAVYPSFAFQSASSSDNRRHRWLDRGRRWCGGLRWIQKVNEWTCRHHGIFVALHILAAMIAAGMILLWRIR